MGATKQITNPVDVLVLTKNQNDVTDHWLKQLKSVLDNYHGKFFFIDNSSGLVESIKQAVNHDVESALLIIDPSTWFANDFFKRLYVLLNQFELDGVSAIDNVTPNIGLDISFALNQELTQIIDYATFYTSNHSFIPSHQISITCCLLSYRAKSFIQQLPDKKINSLGQLLNENGLAHAVCDHVFVASNKPIQNEPLLTNVDTQPITFLQKKIAPILKKLEDKQTQQFTQLDSIQKPTKLHIAHNWGGGIERWLKNYALSDTKYHHLVLKPSGDWKTKRFGEELSLFLLTPYELKLNEWQLITPTSSTSATNLEYKTIISHIVKQYNVQAVLISSLIGHSLEALTTKLKTIVILHDYYPICPAINCYFNEVCPTCDVPRLTQCQADNPLNQFFDDKNPEQWLALRNYFFKYIDEYPIQLVAPSHSVKNNISKLDKRFEKQEIKIIPHGVNVWPKSNDSKTVKDSKNAKLRLILLGSMNQAKGESLLLQALDQLVEIADIYLLGCSNAGAKAFYGKSGVHIINKYDHQELPQWINNIKPDIALLLSIVPETFSYTLSELKQLQIPVIAINQGSFAERIQHEVDGLLIEPTAEALIQQINRCKQQPALLEKIKTHLAQYKPTTMETMVGNYQKILDESSAASTQSSHYFTQEPTLEFYENKQLIDENEIITIKNIALKDHIDAQQQKLEERINRITTLKHELNQRTEWTQELKTEIEKKQEKLSSKLRRINFLQHQIKAKQEKIGELNQINAERSAWAATINHERLSLNRQLNITQQQLNHRDQLLKHTQQTMEQLLQSRSWKTTKPFRFLVRQLHALKHHTLYTGARIKSATTRTQKSLKNRGLLATIKVIKRVTVNRLTHQKPVIKPTIRTTKPTLESLKPIVLPKTETINTSIIIFAHNHLHHTYSCIQSITQHTKNNDYEIIVIDDASTDDTQAMLKLVKNLMIITNEQHLGTIASYNKAVADAKGEYLIFLHNHTSVTDDWLQILLDTYHTSTNIGLVGPKIINEEGKLETAGNIMLNNGSLQDYGKYKDPNHPSFNFMRNVDYCVSSCLIIKKKLFNALGGFESHYDSIEYASADLAFKARTYGREVIYQPAATIISHKKTSTLNTKKDQKTLKEHWQQQLEKQPHKPTVIDKKELLPEEIISQAANHTTKKHALIIDAYVPMPDQDSGSLRMFNIMQVLKKLNYQVSFFPNNKSYDEKYVKQLQQAGIEIYYKPYLKTVNYFQKYGKQLDIIFLSRHYVAENYITLARTYAPQAQLIFDTVDLHYLREEREAKLKNDDVLKTQAAATKKAEFNIAEQCDTTLVVSPAEKEILHQELPHVDVNVLSNIHRIHGRKNTFNQRQDIMFVGGYQHPPNVDGALWFCQDIFPIIREKLPDINCYLIGSKAPDEIKNITIPGIEVKGFVPDIKPYFDDCRLAIAPLRYGAGVKGKVNSSMSYGQPVVATSIAVEGMYAKHKETVMIADDKEAFAQAVIDVYTNEQLWQTLSDNGLNNVHQYFSFEAATYALQDITANFTSNLSQ